MENILRSDVQLSDGQKRLSESGSPFESLQKTPVNHATMVSRGLRGTLNWALIIPRDASLSMQIFPKIVTKNGAHGKQGKHKRKRDFLSFNCAAMIWHPINIYIYIHVMIYIYIYIYVCICYQNMILFGTNEKIDTL